MAADAAPGRLRWVSRTTVPSLSGSSSASTPCHCNQRPCRWRTSRRLRRRLDVALNHQDLLRVRSGRSLLGLGKLGQPVEPTRSHLLQRAERRPVGPVKAPGAVAHPRLQVPMSGPERRPYWASPGHGQPAALRAAHDLRPDRCCSFRLGSFRFGVETFTCGNKIRIPVV